MTHEKYTGTAIALHWMIALMIAVAFSVGLYMCDLKLSPWKLHVYAWHKWLGITILGLVFFRIVWRVSHHPPPLPVHMTRWMKRISGLAHAAIYVLMIAIPFTGWLYSSAAGVSVVYLNLIPLPDLIGKDKTLSHFLMEVHEFLNWTMLALVALHVVAALKHQFMDHDHLLERMRP